MTARPDGRAEPYVITAGATPRGCDIAVQGCLTALGLLAHAVWDEFHHHTNRVVPRSFAQFCAVLDYTLAAIILSLTILTAVN